MIEYDAIYVQLMKSLKEKMIHGEYRIGDKLDSERAVSYTHLDVYKRQTYRKGGRSLWGK